MDSSIKSSNENKIITNQKLDLNKADFARRVILELQNDALQLINKGNGPFVAAIYDDKGNIISKCANSVVNENCSNNHAEINAIRKAEEIFGTYDLSPYNLSIYITSEPCMMCLGAILWSGIKSVYYGVPTQSVEQITGYDEGFKLNWFEEFAKRGICVYGNIEPEIGKNILKNYVENGHEIYKPAR